MISSSAIEDAKIPNYDSILVSVKKMLGITEDYTHFDPDLIIHINSVFMILTQLGVGPNTGFSIRDETSTWADYMTEKQNLESVKSYIYMKVKLMFDPPANSFTVDSLKRLTDEFEWRLNVEAESEEV